MIPREDMGETELDRDGSKDGGEDGDRVGMRCVIGGRRQRRGRGRETMAETGMATILVAVIAGGDAEIRGSRGRGEAMRHRHVPEQPLRGQRQGKEQGDGEAHVAHAGVLGRRAPGINACRGAAVRR